MGVLHRFLDVPNKADLTVLKKELNMLPVRAGEGYGARDVAYLLTSSVQRRVLGEHESSLLRQYHSALLQRLSSEQANRYTFEIFEDHFELSVADFVRFMAGWGYWGASSWADEKTAKVLKRV